MKPDPAIPGGLMPVADVVKEVENIPSVGNINWFDAQECLRAADEAFFDLERIVEEHRALYR